LDLAFYLGPSFPLDDVEAIGTELSNSGAIVAGYTVPPVGMFSIAALTYAEQVDQLKTTILPDLNIVSRMAHVAQNGISMPLDEPTKLAVNIIAFAQAMDIEIEPSIAFHELAYRNGNEMAHEKLRWFRAADRNQAQDWINISRGRNSDLPEKIPSALGNENLSLPLNRWLRNYLLALKIAELELTTMRHVDRAVRLLDWMVSDFFIAGPAAIFSTMYFSPNSTRRRMMKQLRSADRVKAIAGIKNATWDITHLSDFARRSKLSESQPVRFLFATADKNLARIAPLLLIDCNPNDLHSELSSSLSAWWEAPDADCISRKLSKNLVLAETRELPTGNFAPAVLNDQISKAEKWILDWREG
jgi:hypothetical protein